MNTVRKSVAINMAQNYGVMALQFASSVILARLLSPSEIGIYSVAASLIALAQAVRDFGVGQYIIQEKELTNERIRSAFAVSLTIAIALALITAICALPVATFYKEPGIGNILFLLSINFLIIPFGQISMACLQREMIFLPIATAKIVAATAYATTVLSLAYLGYSYMSLAWASIAGTLASVAVATIYRPKHLPWLPGFTEISRVLNFGSFAVGTNLAGSFAKGTPDMVVGRLVNMTSVGLLSRANGLVEIFNQGVMNAVWSVALPHFSKTVRENGDIKGEFLNAAEIITGVAWSFFITLALLSEPLTLFLYGEKWAPSIPLVKWICAGYFVIAPFYLYNSILVSTGNIKTNFKIEIICLFLQFIFYIIAASIGSLELIASMVLAYQSTKCGIVYLAFRKFFNLRLTELFRALYKSMIISLVTGLSCQSFITLFKNENISNIQWLIIGGLGSALGMCVSATITNHKIIDELKISISKKSPKNSCP
jgi:O-antigen/teichoic acid export membrane protein